MADTTGAALNYLPIALWMAFSLYYVLTRKPNLLTRQCILTAVFGIGLLAIVDFLFFQHVIPVLLGASWIAVLGLVNVAQARGGRSSEPG